MKSIRLAVFGLFVVGVALPASLAAQAQSTTGIIRGQVVSSDGNPVASAQIFLTETRTNFQRTLSTNSDGVFAASLLPLGEYDVTARAIGLQEASQTGLRLRVGQVLNLNLILGTAVALQAIVVMAEEPVIDVAKSESSTRLSQEAVEGLPNNGRNFLSLTLLTPGVAIVQGPDGDELSIAGQLGIHNNVSVDGADFNNPFFGEHRGGQRSAFTFNLDAVEEIVVVAQGANAEFGRSSGGFINVITKSGTNTLSGSAHYFGKYDALSANPFHVDDAGVKTELTPDFSQHQFGITLGGPIVRDKAFFFIAYDQQEFNDTRQTGVRGDATLTQFLEMMFPTLVGDFGPIDRTNDARAFMAKFDFRLSPTNNLSLKYNYSWSEQDNGTFDVDVWGRSANARERDFSHAVNGALSTVLGSNMTNELRFQYSREDRPRPYNGPNAPNGRPFPDTGVDFAGYRFGMPFFIPVEDHDTRIQILDNITIASGDHLFKIGAEWNRTETVQTFIGFANGRIIFSSVNGFINYVNNGNQYVECDDGTSNTTGSCGAANIVGPVLLYLQFAGVGGLTVDQAGTQSIAQNELAFYVQDSWQASPSLTLNYGVRWEAQIQPDPITDPGSVFFSSLIGTTNNGQAFPSDGTIQSDYGMIQPRFGLVFNPNGTGEQVFRANAGIYYARVPGLNLASIRSTNGSVGQTIFRNSALTGILGPPPNYNELVTPAAGTPFSPDVFVMDQNFSNPRTISATVSYERHISNGISGSLTYTHASTDNLTRFINRNDGAFGSPWSPGSGSALGGNGIGTLTTVESTARSRYNGVTVGLRRTNDPDLNFQINYTISRDRSDDDNERDPFSFRYADAGNLDPEYGLSDRDQTHRVNAWVMARLPGDFFINNRISYYSAQPASESCGPRPGNPFAAPAGARAAGPADRVCADGSIVQRNTIRKDNAFFSWDIKFSKPIFFGDRQIELIVDVFNVTNNDNFRDPGATSLLFNFDGTLRSGLGNPREMQVGARYRF